MIIVVLMAGNSIRFKEKGYTTPKPFIELKENLSILDYTLKSISNINDYKIYFTLRNDWSYRAEEDLLKKYKNSHFVYFDGLTRGSLETAFLSIAKIKCNSNESVMFLDCDNHYDGSDLINTISHITAKDFGCVCCFDPIDSSDKWGFVISRNDVAVKFLEKDANALLNGGMPMIGNFYFSSIKLFRIIAEKCLYQGTKVKNEFFMTQAMQKMIDVGIPVYVYKSPKMVPLGTPEEFEIAKRQLL